MPVSYKKVVPFLNPPAAQHTAQDPADAVIATENQNRLFTAVLKLDVPFKDVVILYYYQQLGIPAIAETLGIAEGTVRSRLHRAKEQLKQMLTERGESVESAGRV